MLAQSSLKSDCFCCGFKNKIFVIISLCSAHILWRKSNCTSAKGHTGLKEGALCRVLFLLFHPCLPQPEAWKNAKNHLCLLEQHGDAAATLQSHTFPCVGVGSPAWLWELCLQQNEWHKDKLSSPSSCDKLQRFSILPGQESERELHFSFIQSLTVPHCNLMESWNISWYHVYECQSSIVHPSE